MTGFTRNHYVPQWYQYRFIPPARKENKFHYLDLKPESRVSPGGHGYTRKALLRWGPPNCFCQDDLYTTQFGGWKSTEIEEKFFGPIDDEGKRAVTFFGEFEYSGRVNDNLMPLLRYMSLQKLRTPKGLADFASLTGTADKNDILMMMQSLQQMYCAIWMECVWSIADASESQTKFIVSDHPVTVYNMGCFPASRFCQGHSDPDIRLTGTHTIFPMSIDKILILTNLSWVRDPYGSPLKPRPNPNMFRSAIMKYTNIQTGRMLSDEEVNEINYIIKSRAYRYVAAAEKEWLYPEDKFPRGRWGQLGDGYLLFPDPRSAGFGGQFIAGWADGTSDAWDEYGRKPGQPGYRHKDVDEREWNSHHAFQGEFARVFGPKRRGSCYEIGGEITEVDSDDYHEYHLGLERLKPRGARNRKRRRR